MSNIDPNLYKTNLKEQSVYSHLLLFSIITSLNIAIILCIFAALFLFYQKHHQQLYNLKYVYKLYIGGLILDFIANLYACFRFTNNQSVVTLQTYQLFSVNLTFIQIATLQSSLFQVQRIFSVLDPTLEKLINPCQLVMIIVTIISISITTISLTYILITLDESIYLFMTITSCFIIYSVFTMTVGLYILLRIRACLISHYKEKKPVSEDQNNEILFSITVLQRYIIIITIIILLLTALIALVLSFGLSLLDEALALASIFLTILRFISNSFFETCKKIALFKAPIKVNQIQQDQSIQHKQDNQTRTNQEKYLKRLASKISGFFRYSVAPIPQDVIISDTHQQMQVESGTIEIQLEQSQIPQIGILSSV